MSTRAPADASDVKLWTVVVAVVLAAAPIGGADAAFDALDGTAAGTRRAQRMNNATTTSPPPAPPPSVFSATAEEMLDLVAWQQAFEAASRLVSVVQEMTDTLLELGR